MMEAPMMDKKMKADMEEARKRLASISKNPVSEAAMDNMEDEDPDNMDEIQKQWRPVEELARAARQLYFDGELSCAEAVSNLADSLSELAEKKGSSPKDKEPEKESEEKEYPKA